MRRTTKSNVAQVVGGIMFVAALLVGLMYFAGFWRASSSYTVSAYVPNARGIAENSTVFEAGLPVGLVSTVKRNGPDAILVLRIDHGPKPVPVDSTIQLGLRSLAGEADVLLTLGHSQQMVRNNGSLGLSRTQDYTEVDQILNELAGPTEGKARAFFQGFGDSVNGQGINLNHTVGGFSDLVNSSPPLTSTLAVQREHVADVVQYFGDVMGAIGQRTQAMQTFANGAVTTFNTVAARDVALKGMLHNFPYAVASVAAVGTSLRNNETDLGTLVLHLSNVIHKLNPTVDLLQPGASNGIKIFNALGQASPVLKSVLVNLQKLKPSATKAFPAVHALTCQVNPMLRFLSPYGRDLAAFFENFGAVTDAYSVTGARQLMTSAMIDPTALIRGVQNQPVSNALTTLFNFGLFKKAGGVIGFHELPPPGHRDDITYGAGSHTPAEFGATHKYPHVTADCNK